MENKDMMQFLCRVWANISYLPRVLKVELQTFNIGDKSFFRILVMMVYNDI